MRMATIAVIYLHPILESILDMLPANRPATAFRRGRVVNTHKPSFYGGTCIMVASFRVVVTAGYGTIVNIGTGSMTYKSGSSSVKTFTFPTNNVMIYPNYGICSNTVGANSLGTEFNGTFGSGKPRNRGTSGNVPPGYTYSTFTRQYAQRLLLRSSKQYEYR